ncbi:hypothetical protein T4D_16596 [Trichinella pseudospiralis]|uniref:Transmembrane protein n=1 Tax=Trichinella pseudospiralis TaxID=6337 RepID=A0A0V1G3D9_TRIPS|nr:hypothetical protein T4D_16596 [Trichinella pseudospiralis]
MCFTPSVPLALIYEYEIAIDKQTCRMNSVRMFAKLNVNILFNRRQNVGLGFWVVVVCLCVWLVLRLCVRQDSGS